MSTSLSSDDAQFLNAFESGRLEKAAFKHRDHVRLAWILLRAYGSTEARDRVVRGIRAFAALHGVPGLFHVTVTEAWMRVVEMAVSDDAGAAERPESFDAWIPAHPALLDGGLLGRYFSDALLTSDAARVSWVEPDREPLPMPNVRSNRAG